MGAEVTATLVEGGRTVTADVVGGSGAEVVGVIMVLLPVAPGEVVGGVTTSEVVGVIKEVGVVVGGGAVVVPLLVVTGGVVCGVEVGSEVDVGVVTVGALVVVSIVPEGEVVGADPGDVLVAELVTTVLPGIEVSVGVDTVDPVDVDVSGERMLVRMPPSPVELVGEAVGVVVGAAPLVVTGPVKPPEGAAEEGELVSTVVAVGTDTIGTEVSIALDTTDDADDRTDETVVGSSVATEDTTELILLIMDEIPVGLPVKLIPTGITPAAVLVGLAGAVVPIKPDEGEMPAGVVVDAAAGLVPVPTDGEIPAGVVEAAGLVSGVLTEGEITACVVDDATTGLVSPRPTERDREIPAGTEL
jgi:hypothetical protein